jgi:phage baseplate assembly protein W
MADLGTDLGCVSDLTSTMSLVSGRRALGEACARRLQTPRGRLIKHPNYGYDLTGELNGDLAVADIARIQSNV